MKKILAIVFVLCTLLMFSCAKENPPHQLFIGATLDSKVWVAQPTTAYHANRDTLEIDGIQATNSQNLQARIRFNGIGNYEVKNGEAFFLVTLGPVGGSGPTVQYQLDTTQTNTINITSFNIRTNIATGKFQLHFIAPQGGNTASLTNGSFWIQLPPVN